MARLRQTTASTAGARRLAPAGIDGAPEQYLEDYLSADELAHLDEARVLGARFDYVHAYEEWANDLYERTGQLAPDRPPWRPRRRHPQPTPPLPNPVRQP